MFPLCRPSRMAVPSDLLSVPLSVDPDMVRYSLTCKPADRTKHQWFSGFMSESPSVRMGLISVRSDRVLELCEGRDSGQRDCNERCSGSQIFPGPLK